MLTGRQIAILAIMLTAVSPSLFKVSDLPVLRLVFWRLMLATILYAILFVCTHQRPKWIEVRSGFWGGLSFAGQLVLYAVAVRHTSVANAMVISSLQPLVLLGIAGPLFSEKPHRSLYGWSALAIFGAVVAAKSGSATVDTSLLGDLLALAGMLVVCIYWATSKWARTRVATAPYQLWLTAFATIAVVPAALISGHGIAPPVGTDWWPVLLLAGLGGIGHLLLNHAHASVPLPMMGLIYLLNIVLIPLHAWWLLGEAVGGIQALGIGVVLIALLIAVTQPVNQPLFATEKRQRR
jgi:drug/metabolite transporter (DMT)-like permease